MTHVDSLLEPDEVCQWLRLPKSTLYKMCRTGEIPCHKIGKHWRFDREKVQGWLAAHIAPERADGGSDD